MTKTEAGSLHSLPRANYHISILFSWLRKCENVFPFGPKTASSRGSERLRRTGGQTPRGHLSCSRGPYLGNPRPLQGVLSRSPPRAPGPPESFPSLRPSFSPPRALPAPSGCPPCLARRVCRMPGGEDSETVGRGRGSYFCDNRVISLCLPWLVLGVKNPPATPEMKRRTLKPWAGKKPWRRARQPAPAFSPGESQGQRSLAGLESVGSQSVRHD